MAFVFMPLMFELDSLVMELMKFVRPLLLNCMFPSTDILEASGLMLFATAVSFPLLMFSNCFIPLAALLKSGIFTFFIAFMPCASWFMPCANLAIPLLSIPCNVLDSVPSLFDSLSTALTACVALTCILTSRLSSVAMFRSPPCYNKKDGKNISPCRQSYCVSYPILALPLIVLQ